MLYSTQLLIIQNTIDADYWKGQTVLSKGEFVVANHCN